MARAAGWFEEACHPRWRQRMRIERVLLHERSAHQELLIFESRDFGRVLALDGIVQVTERDEFIYHEMISHVPLIAHERPRDVLIIGGGDGGTLEEVLKHPVGQVTMVELDEAVVAACREHLPTICGGAFDDPRVQLRFADGVRFVAETDQRFDAIIVDSTDPVGPGEVLFGEAFYADCHGCLRPGGVLAGQWGNPFGALELLAGQHRRLSAAFRDVGCFTAAIPSYVGGVFAFGFASDDPARRRLTAGQLAGRTAPEGLRQYAPAVHAAAFVHPPWLAAAFETDAAPSG